MTLYNIYCDESCHLENDRQKAMVLGAIWCPSDRVRNISKEIRKIKTEYKLSPLFEIKWTKLSPAKSDFYFNLLDYFYANDNLHLRALIVPDKDLLKHQEFNQNHETWYYKMYFDMLKIILEPANEYCIYIDIKDTRSANKIAKLHEVLCNNVYDFDRKIIRKVQSVRSNEIELIQLTDLLIGSISYKNRGLNTSSIKKEFINRMINKSGYELDKTTLPSEKKVNIFRWSAKTKNALY